MNFYKGHLRIFIGTWVGGFIFRPPKSRQFCQLKVMIRSTLYPEKYWSLMLNVAHIASLAIVFFVFYFLVLVLLMGHCLHSRTHALTVARSPECTHASFIALITREDENTVSISLYRGALLSVPFSQGVGGFK